MTKWLFIVNLVALAVFLALISSNYREYRGDTKFTYWAKNVSLGTSSPITSVIGIQNPNLNRLLVQTRQSGGEGCNLSFTLLDGVREFTGFMETKYLGFEFLSLDLPRDYAAATTNLTLTIKSIDSCKGTVLFPATSETSNNINVTTVYRSNNPLKLLQERTVRNNGLGYLEFLVVIAALLGCLIIGSYFTAFGLSKIENLKIGLLILIIFWGTAFVYTFKLDKNKLVDFAYYHVNLTSATEGFKR